MFAPGREFRMLFDSSIDRYSSELPMSFAVTVMYSDSRKKKYKETSTLDFDIHRGAAYAVVHGVHDAVKQLKEISQTLKRSAIARGLVKVVHERHDEYERRRAAEVAEQRASYDELMSKINPVDEDADSE